MADYNPRGPTPATYDPDLGENQTPGDSLIEELGEVADEIRQLATDFGARPYTYHSVTLRWSGGEIGRGEATVVSDVQILPTPRTGETGWLNRQLVAGGAQELGDLVLTGVSPRYTEDEIERLFGIVVDAGCETFIEQRIDRRDGEPRRRRFVLAKPPERRADRCDWRVVLADQAGGRQRDGTPRVERSATWRR